MNDQNLPKAKSVAPASRRLFLKSLAGAGLAIAGMGKSAISSSAQVDSSVALLTVSSRDVLNSVPLDYTGLSVETLQLQNMDYFSPSNTDLIALLRRLNPHGVLRIGGNSSEFCWWNDSPDSHAPSEPTAGQGRADNWMPQQFHAITPEEVKQLAAFLRATGWALIYGLNFGTGTPERNAVEAEYVAGEVGAHLKYFQIGNEPDFYSQPNNLLRPAGWGFSDYMNEWTAIAQAVIARVPNAKFGGPDVGSNSDWVVRFAEEAPTRLPGRISTLSGHYYASGPPDSPNTTIENLLRPNNSVQQRMMEIIPAANRTGLEFRMTEGNSCYRGGKPKMSDAFASSLWGADYMLLMASLGCKGINLHSGSGSVISSALGGKLPGAIDAAELQAAKLGSFYSPIAGMPGVGFTARPIFYGMMLSQQFGGLEMIRCDFDAGNHNITAYAARDAKGRLCRIALFNKDESSDITVTIESPAGEPALRAADAWRLTGPSLDATEGITLAGASIGSNASWHPATREHIRAQRGALRIPMPRASGALLFTTVDG